MSYGSDLADSYRLAGSTPASHCGAAFTPRLGPGLAVDLFHFAT
jgi:hypothetical protein